MRARRSRIREKVEAGKPAVGIKLNLMDPRVVDLVGACGFDYVFICMEHVPNSVESVENQVRAAKAHDMDALVRVRRGSYSDLIYPLEMDAAGVVVPHMMSVPEAQEVVSRTRFHPLGRRAWDGGNADGSYCLLPAEEYIQHSNNKLVVVQIEDPEATEHIDGIAAVPGVDMLLFGPGDYSHGLGLPGQYNHPKCLEVRKEVAAAAGRNGKIAVADSSLQEFEKVVEEGFQVVLVSADVVALSNEFSAIARGLGIWGHT